MHWWYLILQPCHYGSAAMSLPLRFAFCLALSPLLLSGCAATAARDQPPLTSTAVIDLPRFMGAWHVIAHIPYWPERGKVASRDEYRLRADGRIDNDFVFRTSFAAPERRWHGTSRVLPGSNGAHWQVQFIWPFKADLLVLEVDPDYRWALLGHPQRKYAWIFAREPRMDDATLDALRERFSRYGYAPTQLLRVPQFADQVDTLR
ncbi:MAG: lipocalin [Lysobacterales bacterium CG17_big_fil_post_rev_8_21_14_2_50_64_11]|nr:MAG: lipocalin [Xanthomonadales bacterium CG17_big_fil_post_rev_8_21_14_2_50_64_11]PIX60502.1 MAG: lipocalin [Xanthomonadales bacterium CG_4_10_14_3_um_filter_64_11]